MTGKFALLVCAALFAGVSTVSAEPTVEVLHWMTSGGQAKAMKSLKDDLESQGGKWIDSPMAGGGGEAAMMSLRSRALAGDPPASVQLKGPLIQEWGELGVLSSVSGVAESENWAGVLPEGVADIMKYDGQWVAAPVNVHRLDWLYANPAVLEKAGIEIPRTWDEFNAAAEKLQAMDITPLAHGGQSWQDASVWEVVVLGIGGPEFHKKALVDLDPEALNSETMVKVFDQMRKLRGFVDDGFSGRDWNLATTMVMNGEAAFQIMGDWVKGEFMAAGKEPGKDFICANPPGTDNGYLFIIDSFAMFEQGSEDKQAGQKMFASLLMGPKFQETFNLYKGSIPVRTDISLDNFDDCARASNAHMLKTSATGGFLPSATHDMSVRSAVKGAIFDVVTKHFNSDMSGEDAAKQLSDAIALAQ